MQHAIATNQIPFALLRPLNGIPVLVRILAAGEKQVCCISVSLRLKHNQRVQQQSKLNFQLFRYETTPDTTIVQLFDILKPTVMLIFCFNVIEQTANVSVVMYSTVSHT